MKKGHLSGFWNKRFNYILNHLIVKVICNYLFPKVKIHYTFPFRVNHYYIPIASSISCKSTLSISSKINEPLTCDHFQPSNITYVRYRHRFKEIHAFSFGIVSTIKIGNRFWVKIIFILDLGDRRIKCRWTKIVIPWELIYFYTPLRCSYLYFLFVSDMKYYFRKWSI